MTRTISTEYVIDYCTCYDLINASGTTIAVEIEPHSGYRLVYLGDDGTESEISGFAILNINAIDTFNNYVAISAISDDELTAEEALAIITGEAENEKK